MLPMRGFIAWLVRRGGWAAVAAAERVAVGPAQRWRDGCSEAPSTRRASAGPGDWWHVAMCRLALLLMALVLLMVLVWPSMRQIGTVALVWPRGWFDGGWARWRRGGVALILCARVFCPTEI